MMAFRPYLPEEDMRRRLTDASSASGSAPGGAATGADSPSRSMMTGATPATAMHGPMHYDALGAAAPLSRRSFGAAAASMNPRSPYQQHQNLNLANLEARHMARRMMMAQMAAEQQRETQLLQAAAAAAAARQQQHLAGHTAVVSPQQGHQGRFLQLPQHQRVMMGAAAGGGGLDLLHSASLGLSNDSESSRGVIGAASVQGFRGGLKPPPFASSVSGGMGSAAGYGVAPNNKQSMDEDDASDATDSSQPGAATAGRKPPSKLYIDDIREWDVLCGRGGRSNHHPGNKRYRHVISEMKLMYRKTEAKALKTDLSKAIVEHVCNYGGRFVKKDDTGRYYVLTKAEARKKTSQALRETKELKWTH